VLSLNSQELLLRFQKGDSRAAAAIFDRYVQRLLALARSRIGHKLRRRIDAEDVVQSAYRSFFVHAKSEEYLLTRSGDLWRLLAGITLNKLYGQVERHTAARRSINREDPESHFVNAVEVPEPMPSEAVAIIEQLRLVSERLTSAERAVLTARLQGRTVEEIGEMIEKSPRTVRRLLAKTRRHIEQHLVTSKGLGSSTNIQTQEVSESRTHLSYTDYVLERLLGAGGMGKVYRATQRSTGMQVAIKALLKSRQGDMLAVEKFLQEAQILAELNHANIVGVQGVGRFPGGGYFIVMDLVDGTDLQSLIARGPLGNAEAVRLVRIVAIAIAYAHDQGFVHGDLKPANVLIDRTNHVVVSDFGLAQFIVSEAKPNKPRWLVGGTAGFLAPELRTYGNMPSRSTDIYSLGALLWALATGSAPDGPVSSSENKLIAKSLSRICAKCLATNPGKRYPSSYELVEALSQIDQQL
jgi:eukaryotic-like serine/threonine-protein kinase